MAKKKKKISASARRKQKILARVVIALKFINIAIVVGFFIYLYFWVRSFGN